MKKAAARVRRRYVSPIRQEASAETRSKILDAADRLMCGPQGLKGFSLEAVAAAASVTRVTVHNQFGSRRGLLEALMERIVHRTGITRITDTVARDPLGALDQLLADYCRFWDDEPAVFAIEDAMTTDSDLSAAVQGQIQIERSALAAVVAHARADLDPRKRAEIAGAIVALSSTRMFRMLKSSTARPRRVDEILKVIRTLCRAALYDLEPRASIGDRAKR